ncbi:hypothetical protein J6590_039730 [Homalodisca vitripennis]|nr:hypothetical protein J6590_039730 [Homalodisca vitripennis]
MLPETWKRIKHSGRFICQQQLVNVIAPCVREKREGNRKPIKFTSASRQCLGVTLSVYVTDLGLREVGLQTLNVCTISRDVFLISSECGVTPKATEARTDVKGYFRLVLSQPQRPGNYRPKMPLDISEGFGGLRHPGPQITPGNYQSEMPLDISEGSYFYIVISGRKTTDRKYPWTPVSASVACTTQYLRSRPRSPGNYRSEIPLDTSECFGGMHHPRPQITPGNYRSEIPLDTREGFSGLHHPGPQITS